MHLKCIIHWEAISNATILKIEDDLLDTYLSLTDKEMDLSSMEGKNWQELVQDVLGYDPFRCNKCKKGMMLLDSRIDVKPRAA